MSKVVTCSQSYSSSKLRSCYKKQMYLSCTTTYECRTKMYGSDWRTKNDSAC